MVKNILGYVLALAGLAGLAVSSFKPVSDFVFTYIPEAALKYVEGSLLVVSLIILGVGVFLLVVNGKGRNANNHQAEEEVPIYEGAGKKRKIVGYRRS